MKYNFSKIELRWQKIWEKQKLYQAELDPQKRKWYSLFEFPYPSGDGLHVGHLRPYIGMDVISRKRRMQGYNVLFPIGWDAFGLPTENYAIKTGVAPQAATKRNTDNFRKQIKSSGVSLDWSREINTTDPHYYKWTQWMFLKFFERGLAYKAAMPINWCPKDKIGLANEEVINGKCERCGAAVEKRVKEQWMIKITAYADKLLRGLKEVDYLPQIKIQQENWIGRSEGALIRFKVKCDKVKGKSYVSHIADSHVAIEVFTTRPDTLFGATYMVLSPEHPLIKNLESGIKNLEEVKKYIKEAGRKTEMERTAEDKEKTGVELKGIKAVNPANNEEIPVFISDYVLATYGTGAIMAVPAHDERDFAFAKKFNLPIKTVIEPVTGEMKENEEFRESIVAIVRNPQNDKFLSINWGSSLGGNLFIGGGRENGEDWQKAAEREILEETGYKNIKFISKTEIIHHHYRAHSKNVNRNISAIGFYFELLDDNKAETNLAEDEKGKFKVEWITKGEAEAKVADSLHALVFRRLVKGEVYIGSGILVASGKFSGLESEKAKRTITDFVGGRMTVTYKLRDWIFSRQRYWGEPIPIINCPKCGYIPVPEKDLPVKLPPVKNYHPRDDGESPLASVTKWVNVKCPKCGGLAKRETDTMPNWAGSSWYFLAYTMSDMKKPVSIGNWKLEIGNFRYWMPIDWYNGGMEHTTLHLLYSRFWNRFLYDIGLVPYAEPYKKRTAHGLILAEGGAKMSKSKGNVINPDTIVKEFGADALRLYEMFMGPFDQAIAWDARGILGPSRFLERVWKLFEISRVAGGKSSKNLQRLLHKTIKKVSEDIEAMNFNTAVSAMMIFINEAEKQTNPFSSGDQELFLKILAPFAPHIADDLWHKMPGRAKAKSIHLEKWPDYDPSMIKEDTFELVIQINGKVRDSVSVPAGITQKEVEKLTLKRENVIKHLSNKKPQRIVYIPGRLINIVIEN